jgi:hypothetical protein
MTIPEDFPRDPFPSAIPGTQAKFSARLIDGKFVVGLTAEELQERYAACEDLALQLIARTQRKKNQGLLTDIDAFFEETEIRLRAQNARDDWGFSDPELIWISMRVRASGV